MFRAIPIGNKVLSKKWDEQKLQIHYDKLKRMKSSIDKSCPASFNHLKRKLKKEQMVEERFTEIERENRLLLEKMSHIMIGRSSRSSTQPKKSLNRELRKRQLVQITAENQALLKRLQEKQPSYNVHKWEDDRRDSERRLQFMCEFPYALGNSRNRKSNDGRWTPGNQLIRNSTSSGSKKPRKLSPLGESNLVFKKGLTIGGKYFLIEMYKAKKNIKIVVFDTQTPESFSLSLPSKELIEICNGKEDYDYLAGMLQLEEGELVLVDDRTNNLQSNTVPASINESKDMGIAQSARNPSNRNFSQDISHERAASHSEIENLSRDITESKTTEENL